MLKKSFVVFVLCLIAVFLVACDSPPRESESLWPYSPMEWGELSEYSKAIEDNQEIFEVTLTEQYSELAQTMLLRADIKNISDKTYNWILFDLVFADDDNNALDTAEAGVYSHIAPQETVSIFLFDADESITKGYVVDFIDNYFNF